MNIIIEPTYSTLRKYLFVVLLLLVSGLFVHAERMVARQIPFFYELSSNEIFDVYQDNTGYLWFGTTNGLERYDGYQLQTLRSDFQNPDLLTNNSIVSITDNGKYIWIGTRNGVNLFNKETYVITPFPDEALAGQLTGNMKVDSKGFTWISTRGHIYKCDANASIIKKYTIPPSQEDSHTDTHAIYEDSKGHIWALTWGKGLFKYDPASDSFYNYPPVGTENIPFSMHEDHLGNYWIGTWGDGLWQFFPEKEGADCYKKHLLTNSRTGESEPIVFSIIQDDTYQYLWMLSYNELYALDISAEGTLEKVDIHNLVDTYKMYTRIFKDREGNLWLGSYDMAYTIFFDNSRIDNYPVPQLKEQLNWDTNLLHLCLDNDSIMWINQDRFGLCLYDLYHNRIYYHSMDEFKNLSDVDFLIKSNAYSGVWVKYRHTGTIVRLEQKCGKIVLRDKVEPGKLTGNPGGIKQLAEDKKGNLWIVTQGKIFVKPFGRSASVAIESNLPEMAGLAMDNMGGMWGLSLDNKIYHLAYSAGYITNELKAQITVFSPQEQIRNVCIDEAGCIWLISSLGSIYRSDKDKQTFKTVPLKDKMIDCTPLDILSDKDKIWIVTNKKIIQYNLLHDSSVDYLTTDGNIGVNIFRHKAMCPDGKGGLFAGGHGGLMHIYDSSASTSFEHFYPIVTDVKVENKSILFYQSAGKEKQVNTFRKAYLNPQDKNIEIFFSTLTYSLNSKVRFAYKLEGFDREWIYQDNQKHSVFYNRLNKGTYKFRLKAEYEPGKWTEEQVALTIEKLPAFYETWYAWLFYILFAGLCTYTILYLYIQRMKRKNEIRLQEEMTVTKLDYFTNVSHELLTPLTVISGTADYLETKEPSIRKQLGILKSNADRLKRLIQEVLDFRKMDMSKMALSVTWGDIKGFIESICKTNFSSLAQKKNIQIETILPQEEVAGYLDFDKVDKILYNLLSNAIKYSPGNTSIRVEARIVRKEKGRSLLLIVQDQGIGIEQKELEHIFTRFYNNRSGSLVESNGIGLSLTKDLITLHHGTITVESRVGEGTSFTVEIPIDKEYYTTEEVVNDVTNIDIEDIQKEPDLSSDTGRFTILLADDNADLLYLMQKMFEENYQVVTAGNGQEAWDKLNKQGIDMVVCDVMMPDINGWELCRRIKDDLRFNHIPVIILTARNAIDDRITSYKAGADGFVTKPFELKVLQARIDNLLKSYKIRQVAFRQEENVSLESLSYHSADKKFIQSVVESVEKHLDESEFDLDQLSREMNMSKSTLHRKIKSITGLTSLDFVKNIKMKRACMMLLAGKLNISEIAYATGFNDPKYFRKCFKEEFGITPTEYQQSHNR
ncbi:MAG: response regulator [Tannerellaceae bacterium]|nr:response regulator [Tannerellaceae bacterium]